MSKQRLDKIISSTGRYSRKEVRQLIRDGQVAVDGIQASSPEEKYDPETCSITVSSEQIRYRQFVYLMMNKPAGLLSATRDAKDRTVLDLLPEQLQRRGLFPAGRLDRDTEGLLLLTDDGVLAHDILSPKKHVSKRYYVRTDQPLSPEDVRAFAEGITLSDGTSFQSALLEPFGDEPSVAYVTIQEGKFHQIKRMFAYLGKQVVYLKRLQMGPLLLDPALAPGEWRELNEREISQLASLKHRS